MGWIPCDGRALPIEAPYLDLYGAIGKRWGGDVATFVVPNLWDASEGTPFQRKRICRTFSDCTTAPRNGLPSGCYPLDSYYKDSESAKLLTDLKKR